MFNILTLHISTPYSVLQIELNEIKVDVTKLLNPRPNLLMHTLMQTNTLPQTEQTRTQC
jgi:hypothetical protein